MFPTYPQSLYLNAMRLEPKVKSGTYVKLSTEFLNVVIFWISVSVQVTSAINSLCHAVNRVVGSPKNLQSIACNFKWQPRPCGMQIWNINGWSNLEFGLFSLTISSKTWNIAIKWSKDTSGDYFENCTKSIEGTALVKLQNKV